MKNILMLFSIQNLAAYIQCNVIFAILSLNLQPGELVMTCTSIGAPILAIKRLYPVPGELLVQMIIRGRGEGYGYSRAG
jgi:hypothetical protein